jgi:hypothetical protein
MKNKSRKTPYKPTLVEFEMVEITDPAEIAALERRIQAAEKTLAARERRAAAKPKAPKAKPHRTK